jgi:hypothetical protein
MASTCSAVAGSWQASPITTRRTAEWPDEEPGVDADAAVEAVEPVAEARPVPGQAGLSASSGMPSTRAIIRIR